MMRRKLMEAVLWTVPVLLASACGPTVLEEPGIALEQASQSVLYPPAIPASGNIADSTAYLGPVALGGSVQSRFTTGPQYLSFSFAARAGAQVKLEITHLGSAMGLDTGLFVYGPRQVDGSYGTTLRGQDDDAGYGQLSKIASLTLPQQGEYLVVVSSGAGAGKQFRLQLDCLSGTCAPEPEPGIFDLCDIEVATRIEICVQGNLEEIDPVLGRRMTPQEAYDACTGADDAHAAYAYVCGGGAGPAWCAEGEAAFTQRMWPECQEFYRYYYGLYTLTLDAVPLSSNLQSKVAAGNTACGFNCSGTLAAFSFPWTSLAQPRLDNASEAVLALPGYEFHARESGLSSYMTYAQFVQSHLGTRFASLDPDLRNEFGPDDTHIQVAHYRNWYERWPDACEYYNLYVILFPSTHKVLAFDYTYIQDC